MPTSPERSLEQLVRHQVRRWEIEERNRPGAPPACIALSRSPGSGGAEVGLRVAEVLGYGFFGIELVDEIARKTHVQRHLVEGLDEHLRNAVERFLSDGFRSGSFRESDYLRGLMRTLGALSQRGGAVILGRGSPFVLPASRTLRVLVIAPLEFRATRAAAARKLELDAARRVVEAEDAERRRFLGHHFHVDPDDPSLYDLVVNTGTIGPAGAAELVGRAFEERFRELAPRVPRAMQVAVQIASAG